MINLKTIYGFNSFISSTDNLLNIDMFFSVDNRDLDDERIFIAIVGKKYNPLKDLQKVLDSDCRFIVYEDSEENNKLVEKFKKFLVFIKVESIERFIEEAGKAVANTFRTRGGQIIAISGSNGKTTTKEMLFHLLGEKVESEEIICTQKNNNNNLGVPFTLFQIRKKTKYAIVELGSNHPGEIELLARMLYPQYSVTTNIGDTHLEFFETRENVCREESVVAKFTTDKFYKNSDDVLLNKLEFDNSATFGLQGKDYKFTKDGPALSVNNTSVKNENITGVHNFYNMAVAMCIASDVLGEKLESFSAAAASFTPTKNRSEWLDYKKAKVFLDAYNANPSSMLVAIDGFVEHIKAQGAQTADCCLVIGDMNELGANAVNYHKELGESLNKYGFGTLFFVGKFADDFAASYKGNASLFKTTAEARDTFEKHVAQNKFIFIKGSRSLQLETILDIS